MKPPPRKRIKSRRNQTLEPLTTSCKVSCQWQRTEQKNLLKALKTLSSTTRGNGDIDCAFLREHVPTRSISEINTVVEFLKNKVISSASFKLKHKKWEEKKVRKPIEVWTHIASAMAGTLEEPISNAFSQMMIVSSTEPCTLKNCDPPQVYRPPTDNDGPVGRTVPLRPMPVKVEHPGNNTARPIALNNPAAAMSPSERLPASPHVVSVPNSPNSPPQQQLSTTAGTSPATAPTSQSTATCCQPDAAEILVVPSTSPQPASQTVTPLTGQVPPASGSAAAVKTPSVGSPLIRNTQQSNTLLPSEQHPTTISTTSTSKSTSSGPHTSLSSSATTPVPGTEASSGVPPTHPLSTPATACHAKFGRTNKYATKDSPRTFGVKSVVDFERIYRYLSVIHQPDKKCHLTEMESAIVLDLLMSLPEELLLLDCNKLNKHLTQMYRFLSTTSGYPMAEETFKDLKDGLFAQTEAASSRDSNRTNGPQNSDVTDSGRKKAQPEEAESQSSESNNASGQSQDAGVTGLCPPLNPFMVPLKLLMRK
ncbi:snRNA-activating protein complex subunit 2 [Cottoperca gobio]|uniref:snRNA-activating protein complex subunit 2 n=1 Tax=Cottoperca gobio TaxID=56716 RepID=A0A6J2RLP5_COTGO|nr:snRNA-activating protein complex subunit 2 [Cottoperca gobio]